MHQFNFNRNHFFDEESLKTIKEITKFISKNEEYFKDNTSFLCLRLLNEYIFCHVFDDNPIISTKERLERYLEWTEKLLQSKDYYAIFSENFLLFAKATFLQILGRKEEANQIFINFFKKAFRYGIKEPTKLYRFIPLTTSSIYSISEKVIYLNHPSNWNDPFDCNLYDEAEEHFRRARMTCLSHSSKDEEP